MTKTLDAYSTSDADSGDDHADVNDVDEYGDK